MSETYDDEMMFEQGKKNDGDGGKTYIFVPISFTRSERRCLYSHTKAPIGEGHEYMTLPLIMMV